MLLTCDGAEIPFERFPIALGHKVEKAGSFHQGTSLGRRYIAAGYLICGQDSPLQIQEDKILTHVVQRSLHLQVGTPEFLFSPFVSSDVVPDQRQMLASFHRL